MSDALELILIKEKLINLNWALHNANDRLETKQIMIERLHDEKATLKAKLKQQADVIFKMLAALRIAQTELEHKIIDNCAVDCSRCNAISVIRNARKKLSKLDQSANDGAVNDVL